SRSWNGLRKNPAYIPLADAVTADSGRELISMAGISRYSGLSLIARSMPKPSSTGIIKSRITSSGPLSFRSSRPCLPLIAVTTLWPASVRADWSTSVMPNSSSTTKIVAISVLSGTPGAYGPETRNVILLRCLGEDPLGCGGVFVNCDSRARHREPVKGRINERVAHLEHGQNSVKLSAKLHIPHDQYDLGYAGHTLQRKMAKR